MKLDPTILPGLLILSLQIVSLMISGYIIARISLRQSDRRLALAQGMLIGPALWILIANFLLHIIPGLAGGYISWGLLVALALALAWKHLNDLWSTPRCLLGFIVAAIPVFWLALASRQLLHIPDEQIHIAIASTIRFGSHPPILAWNPHVPLSYHYGTDMMIGLSTPPIGPDIALVTEILGAYLWTSFVLLVLALLLRLKSLACVVALAPLLLTTGAWTLVWWTTAPDILRIPIPIGDLNSELLDDLRDIYWPPAKSPQTWPTEATPPNIWKPPFLLAYALAIVILERVIAIRNQGWHPRAVLAGLIGFLGLVEEAVALSLLGLWTIFVAHEFLQVRGTVSINRRLIASLASGPALSMLLLIGGGGILTALLTGRAERSLSLGWRNDPTDLLFIGSFTPLSDNLGILGLGVVPLIVLAVLIAWRNWVVIALAGGSLVFVIAALTLQHTAYPADVVRLDGHARNFALIALIFAAGEALSGLRIRWRHAVMFWFFLLVTWPTTAAPVRNLSLALDRGAEISNAEEDRSDVQPLIWHADPPYKLRGRAAVASLESDEIAAYIRDQTQQDTLVFSPHPHAMTASTGRPNGLGALGHLHLFPFVGPEYDDVARYLEPAAVQRLGYSYLHTTEAWVAGLPDRARDWLARPELFEPLLRTESDALYRIQPAFLQLNVPPAQASFEALRRAIPPSSSVFLAPSIQPNYGVRLAFALPHTRLLGAVEVRRAYLLTYLQIEPLSAQTPDFVALPARMAPSAFPPAARQPVWWNQHVAIYAPGGSTAPLIPPPPPHFSVQVSDVRADHDRIAFTAAFTDRASDRWQGQDWVVVETDASPWHLPYRFGTGTFTSAFVRWFDGQVQPVPETDIHEYFFLYQFVPHTGTLALWDGQAYTDLSSPQPQLRPGSWMLAARPNISREEVGLIPVLHFTLADDGSFTYTVYQGSLDATLNP